MGVSDGDTITVLDGARKQHKIRIAGIDAPEKKQPYGERAKQNLSHLLFGKPVIVEWDDRDRYGRIVGKVWVASPDRCSVADCPKTLDAGLAQVSDGLAWHYKQFENDQTPEDRRRYASAEREARAKGVGLWREPEALPPWVWRRGSRWDQVLNYQFFIGVYLRVSAANIS